MTVQLRKPRPVDPESVYTRTSQQLEPAARSCDECRWPDRCRRDRCCWTAEKAAIAAESAEPAQVVCTRELVVDAIHQHVARYGMPPTTEEWVSAEAVRVPGQKQEETMTETSTELVVREPTRLDELARLGTWLAYSEADDKSAAGRGATAALRLYYAAELDLPPFAAAELSVIGGRLVVSAQLYRALANRAGYRVLRVAGSDATSCTAQLVNADGQIVGESTFTIEDARVAGLAGKSNYKSHPARMLWARASANVIKDFAPGVALGLMTQEEAAEIVDAPVHDAPVREEDIPWPDVDEAETLAELAALEEKEDDQAA